MKLGDIFNLFLAQIELGKSLPFDVTAQPPSTLSMLSSEEQAEAWTEAFGAY